MILRRIFGGEEWRREPLNKIAKHVGVHLKTVQYHREKYLTEHRKMPESIKRRVTRNGTTYDMDVSRIGDLASLITSSGARGGPARPRPPIRR